METNKSMEQYIEAFAEEYCKSVAIKGAAVSVAATVAKTVIANLISLAFGRVAFALHLEKTPTKDCIKQEILRAIYSSLFIHGSDTDYQKNEKKLKMLILQGVLDSLTEDKKRATIELAIKYPERYLQQIEPIFRTMFQDLNVKYRAS
jgi:hypothetical protein